MKTRMYYAESHGFSVTQDTYEGGFLRYPKNSEPYAHLWRFKSKSERDNFVIEHDNHNTITARLAKLNHKDQFIFWKQDDKKTRGIKL
jgi:hypothetical protein